MSEAEQLVQYLLRHGHSAPLTPGLLLTNPAAQAAALEWVLRRLAPYLFPDPPPAIAALGDGDVTERLQRATSLLGRTGLGVPPNLASADGLFADLLALLEGAETVTDGVDAQYERDMHLARAVERQAGSVFATHVHAPGAPAPKPKPAAAAAPPPAKRPRPEGGRCPPPEALAAQVSTLRAEVEALRATAQQRLAGGGDPPAVDVAAVRARWLRLRDLHTATLAAAKAFAAFVEAEVPTAERVGPLGFPLGMACGDAFARRSEVWQMLATFRALQESHQQLCAWAPSAAAGPELTGDHIFALTSTLQTLEAAIERRRTKTPGLPGPPAAAP